MIPVRNCSATSRRSTFPSKQLTAVSFLFTTSGATLLIWGRRAFSGLWPAVLFLGFMLPLPFQIERVLSGPLQVMGASEAAWYIQTFGIPAIAQGNTILMGKHAAGSCRNVQRAADVAGVLCDFNCGRHQSANVRCGKNC